MKLRLSPRRGMFVSAVAVSCVICVNPAHAQESRWAAPDDHTAQALIDWQRQWAGEACPNNGIRKTQSSPNMKSLMNHGCLITGPAFDEGREQRCALYLAVLMRNWFYVIRRIYPLKIAGSR